MPLTLERARQLAAVAAAGTDTLPKRMNARCAVIAEQVFGAMPTTPPAVTARYIALRWRDPERSDPRSHVAVFIEESGTGFVVDASWQQYPYVENCYKNLATEAASNAAQRVGDRVFVGAATDWQDLVRHYNATVGGKISCRMFPSRDAAARWMMFTDVADVT